MDCLLGKVSRGGWATLYGPDGAQNTFLLRYRGVEAARETEPWLALVEADYGMSPRALLARIAQAIAAPYAQTSEPLRRAILGTLRGRKAPLAVAIDEAQLLYKRIDTLEMLRRLGDAAGGRMGILVAGNEQVKKTLFEPRRSTYFEQWRSRIEQIEIQVLGPTRGEARAMLEGELGNLATEKRVEFVLGRCEVTDPISGRKYSNARRLSHCIRDMRGRECVESRPIPSPPPIRP